jgi:hypothetical protein
MAPCLPTVTMTVSAASSAASALLVAAGQFDDAQTAALSAYLRFGEPAFLVQGAELLMKLGRDGKAEEAANKAVGLSGLGAFSRRAAHWILAAVAITGAEDLSSPSLGPGG